MERWTTITRVALSTLYGFILGIVVAHIACPS